MIEHQVSRINAYLVDAKDTFITRRAKALSDVPAMIAGGKPSDGGFLILSPQEREELLRAQPTIEPWIRRFSMGLEFIKGDDRYCLWLQDCPRHVWASMPEVVDRVRSVQHMRQQSPKEATRKKAETPGCLTRLSTRARATTWLSLPSLRDVGNISLSTSSLMA